MRKLFRFEPTSGLLLIGALVAGFVAANSPWAPFYEALHHAPIHFGVGSLIIDEPLIQWINEGLMVLFFLLVGLEIKRELLEGHLSTARRAALPAIAAAGGMIVPAAIYAGLNWADPVAIRGWAIPTATDIVLALGVLSLLGPRVPVSLRVFLTALAIFDDIGAVLIIGLFYGEDIALTPLLFAALAVVGLAILNVLRTTRPAAYVVFGMVLWVGMVRAGIEPALAGIPIALAVPLRGSGHPGISPLREAERRLHPWCVLFVIPLFAFFNAGIRVDGDTFGSLFGPISLGVAGGLFVGKQIGVFAATWLAVRFRLAQLPEAVGWGQVYAVASLAGIGFTMSLFVASLAFSEAGLLATAKLAILLGSLLSALIGICAIHLSGRAQRQRKQESTEPHYIPDG